MNKKYYQDKNCETKTKFTYLKQHNINNNQLKQAKQKCLNNPLCKWTAQKEKTYKSLLSRRLNKEIIKIPAGFSIVNGGSLYPENNIKIRLTGYISKVEEDTIDGLIEVGETGFSLTAPGRIYEIGTDVIDLVNDVINWEFSDTINNVKNRIIPKSLEKVGVKKDIADKIGVGIELGEKLNE